LGACDRGHALNYTCGRTGLEPDVLTILHKKLRSICPLPHV
jgi:hypothetical protein